MRKIVVLLFIFSILSAGIAPVEFDWARFVLKITTTENTGITDLFYKTFMAVQYDETQTVADYVVAHPGIGDIISKRINDGMSTQQNFLTDGGIEYIHQLSLTGKIMHELLPPQQPVRYVVPMLCPCCGQKWPENRALPDTIGLIPQQNDKTDYTGIVFDCSGSMLKPCLFPKIMTDAGKEVYSINFADLSSVSEWGLVQYAPDDGPIPPRAGRKPLVVPVIGTAGAKQTNLIITTADARRIHGSKENVRLLKECRVVIIFSQ